jgi:hypothetical protein
MQQYRDFLAREGDARGIDFWARQVASGAWSRNAVMLFFFDSPEFAVAIAPVVRLYFAFFRRVPDYGGLQFWIGRSRAGMGLGAIAEFFAGSAEFAATYGALDDAAYVELLYNNVLGRAPDPGGRAFWISRLAAGMTRGQVMLGFSESAEYMAASRSKVLATMAYAGMLRRAPEPGGFEFWTRFIDSGNAEAALVAAFFSSAEYRARFLP